MKSVFNIITILAVSLHMASCGGSSRLASSSEEAPSWTLSKPSDPYAYVGIGVAQILPDGSHMVNAKSSALSDLASEISVEVSSTSLLYQMELNREFREEYRAQTEITSFENVEGYELVAAYEGEEYYWVQYKLDKATYARLRAERKTLAVDKAINFYNLAIQARDNREIQTALSHAFSALSDLKPYLNERISHPDVEGDLAIALHNMINGILEDLHVSPVVPEFSMVRYSEAKTNYYFRTLDADGLPLPNIPVYVFYSGGFLRQTQMMSDASANIGLTLPKSGRETNNERLEANINYVALAESATRDPLLQIMVARYPGNKAIISVQVQNPSVYIRSSEKIAGEELSSPPITQSLRQFLLQNKFNVVRDSSSADYLVEIDAWSTQAGKQSNMYQAKLSGEIRVLNNLGLLQGSFPLDSFRGVQLSESLAAEDAYGRAVRELEDHEFRKLFLN